MKHTKGPWVTIRAYEQERMLVINGDRSPVCSIDSNCKTQVANAQLIAAAPELLEALQLAEVSLVTAETLAICNNDLDAMTDFSRVIKTVRQAIAKAEGK